MVKLTQKTVAAFFSPQRKRTTRVNRKLEEAEPVFSESSSSEDDPAHFALERKSQLLDLVDSPPRYITSSSSSEAGDEPSGSRSARKLVRRSEASSSQAHASARKLSRTASTSKLAAAPPAKTAARAQWEGKKGKAVGKEKDNSRPLTRSGKWTDDEDEDVANQVAAGVVDDDWLVSDGSPPPARSKGKGRATGPSTKPKVEVGSDDSDGGLEPLRSATAAPPAAVQTSVEDLLDAAVGSQISKGAQQKPVAVRPASDDDVLGNSDDSLLIMDTPPPDSPPPASRPTKKVAPSPSTKKARPPPTKRPSPVARPTPVKRPTPAKRPAPAKRPTPVKRPVVRKSAKEDEYEATESSSSEEEDRWKTACATQKKTQATEAPKPRKRPLDSSEDEETDEDEDKERRRRKLKKQKKLRRRKAVVNSEDEFGTDSEPDDLEDDRGRLLTLHNRMRTGTERAGTKELARRALLEKLKKRKQQRGSGVTSLLTEDEDEDEENEEEEAYTEIWGRDARGRYATEDDSEFEKEFIEEDDEEIDQLDLPSAFRTDASQPMELNFNVVVQWHVHAIVKGRQWAKKATKDPYFQAPLKRLRDHVISTRNSGVTSQVWPSHFKKALDRFPVFEGFTIKGDSPPCDACRISSRPATRKIELSGKRFDPDTFERIAYDSEESEDEGLKGLDSEFNCGRNCFQRARVYHNMTHWGALNPDDIHEWLCDTIEQLPDEEDERPSTATVRIDGGSHKISSLPSKNDPDRVVEWLSKKLRWVTSQWSELSQLLESGRNLDAEFRRWET